jgi:hypothetical protein
MHSFLIDVRVSDEPVTYGIVRRRECDPQDHGESKGLTQARPICGVPQGVIWHRLLAIQQVHLYLRSGSELPVRIPTLLRVAWFAKGECEGQRLAEES